MAQQNLLAYCTACLHVGSFFGHEAESQPRITKVNGRIAANVDSWSTTMKSIDQRQKETSC